MKFFDFSSKQTIAPEKDSDRPFTRVNFIMMGACVAMIIIGFCLMSGGGSSDPEVFNPDIFSARRIVVGPLIAFLGFLLMAFAIIWTPRGRGKREAREINGENSEKKEGNGLD